MNDLGLIRIMEGIRSNRITLNRVAGKVNLESAPIIKRLREVTQ